MPLVIVAAAGIAGGYFIGKVTPILTVLLTGGLLVGVLGLVRPVFALLALAGTTSYFSIHSPFPGTDIFSIHVPDLVLLYLVAVLLLHAWSSGGRLIVTPCSVPVLAFCLIGGVGVLLSGYLYGANLFEAIQEGKVVAYYLVVFLAANLLRSRTDVRVLTIGLILISCAMSVYVVYQGVFHPPDIDPDDEEAFYLFSSVTAGSEKVGILWTVCVLLALMAIEKPRAIYALGLLLCLSYFILMFHRHMYLGVVLAAVLIGICLGRAYPQRLLKVSLALLILLALLAFALVWGPDLIQQYASLTLQRVQSLKEISGTDSALLRETENRYAWQAVASDPLLGLGFALDYRPKIYSGRDELNRFVHNGYLWILIKLGLVGLVPFLWFSLRFLRRGFGQWLMIEDAFCQAVLLGSTVCYSVLLFLNFISPYFMQNWGVCVIALMIGSGESIIRLQAEGGHG